MVNLNDASRSAYSRQQAPVESSGGYLDVGGGKIYYETRGSGPALALVHNGLLHREMWAMESVREKLSRYPL